MNVSVGGEGLVILPLDAGLFGVALQAAQGAEIGADHGAFRGPGEGANGAAVVANDDHAPQCSALTGTGRLLYKTTV